MSSNEMMLLFYLIIFIFGAVVIYSAVQMKRTGMPAAFLVSREEISLITDKKAFCSRLYLPTVIFGTASCLYGAVALINQYVLHQQLIKFLGAVCFLAVCMWYLKDLQKIKAEYIS